MSVVKRVAKNTSLLIVAQVLATVLSFVLAVFMARFLGDAGYGRLTFAISFTALFIVLSDFGLTTLLIREVAREKEKAGFYLTNVGLLKAVLDVMTFVLIVAAANFFAFPAEVALVVYIIALSSLLGSFSTVFKSIFYAFERMELEAFVEVLTKTFLTAFGLLVLFLGFGLIELTLVMLFAALLQLLLGFFLTVKKIARPSIEIDPSTWLALMKKALPFAISFIFIVIYFRIDSVMLYAFQDEATVGWYNAAYKMIEALVPLHSAFIMAIFPVLSIYFKRARQSLEFAYRKALKFLLIGGVPIVIATLLLADKFILTIFGEQFFNSILALRILILVYPFILFNSLSGTALNAIDKAKLGTLSTGITATFNVLLNLVLIPLYSFAGAAFATVLSEMVNMGVLFYFINKYLKHQLDLSIIIKPLLASLLMGLFIFFFSEINLLLLILLAALVYLVSLFIFKGISRQDLELISTIFKKKVRA